MFMSTTKEETTNNEQNQSATRLTTLFKDYFAHFRFQGINSDEARQSAADLRIVITQEHPTTVTYYAHRVVVFILLTSEFIPDETKEELRVREDLQQELRNWHPKDQKKLVPTTAPVLPLLLLRETSASTAASFLSKLYSPESIGVFATRLQRHYSSHSIAQFFDVSYISSEQTVVPTLKLLLLVCIKDECHSTFGLKYGDSLLSPSCLPNLSLSHTLTSL